ncbi:MAG: protoporphyrinogen oxidase [Actinobacteria bacterium]|nr:protoporphyrinogen oxidase [Actinomycetota bacterium]
MTRSRIVVVGGGITGLATAWYLRHGLDPERGDRGVVPEVTVLEASDRLGGKIAGATLEGTPLDVGADAFLARRPEAERLARRLGLGDDLVAPATGQVWLWVRGRLRPLPTGTVMGVPGDLRALARSGILTPTGLVRAGLEPLLPRRRRAGDRSVGEHVTRRFGADVTDVLVEPLLGGVYAGRADRLSLEAAAPAVADADRSRSLLAGMRAQTRQARGDDRPVFLTVAGGLGRMVDALADGLEDARTGAVVTGLAVADAGGVEVLLGDGSRIAADDVVLTVPAYAAAPLVAPVVPAAARLLAGIPYASVAVVSLAYPAGVADGFPRGSGMLVPPSEGRLVKAATWSSRKWPHLADRDRFLLRASVGRIDDRRWEDLDDTELTARVVAEIGEATGTHVAPVAGRVTRWERSLPQYEVGHARRVRDVRDAVRVRAPWLHVAGAAYDGVGLAPCVAQAEALAGGLTGDRTGRPRD